jgi:Zn-dependent M28 family amino/carboxypeptidase
MANIKYNSAGGGKIEYKNILDGTSSPKCSLEQKRAGGWATSPPVARTIPEQRFVPR